LSVASLECIFVGPVPAKSRLRRHPQSLTTCERAMPLKQRKLTRPVRAESRSRMLEFRLSRLSSTDHSSGNCARDPPLTGVGEGSNDSRKSTKASHASRQTSARHFDRSKQLLRAPFRLRDSGRSQRAGRSASCFRVIFLHPHSALPWFTASSPTICGSNVQFSPFEAGPMPPATRNQHATACMLDITRWTSVLYRCLIAGYIGPLQCRICMKRH
jgi:hypothetical protein